MMKKVKAKDLLTKKELKELSWSGDMDIELIHECYLNKEDFNYFDRLTLRELKRELNEYLS